MPQDTKYRRNSDTKWLLTQLPDPAVQSLHISAMEASSRGASLHDFYIIDMFKSLGFIRLE